MASNDDQRGERQLAQLREQIERQLTAMVGSAKDSKALVALIALSSPLTRVVTSKAFQKIPGIRRLPMMQLLLAGQLAVLAKQHFEHLDGEDRHRLLELARASHGDPRRLSELDREELRIILAKVEPKLFLRTATMHVIRGRAVAKKS